LIWNGIDTFYANLQFLENLYQQQSRSKAESFELRNGNTIIKVTRVPFAYADRYQVILKTIAGNVSGVGTISDAGQLNKKTAAYIKKLMAYISTNQKIFSASNEITPKLYSLLVVRD
jgi:hypothetical protein